MHSSEEQPSARASSGAGWQVQPQLGDMHQLLPSDAETPQELLRALLRAPHGEWLPLRQLRLADAPEQQMAPGGLQMQQLVWLVHALKAELQLHFAETPWELPLASWGV